MMPKARKSSASQTRGLSTACGKVTASRRRFCHYARLLPCGGRHPRGVQCLLDGAVSAAKRAAITHSHTKIGFFGRSGMAGAIAAARAGRLADRGLGQWTTGASLSLLLASWSLIAMLPISAASLAAGIVFLDSGRTGRSCHQSAHHPGSLSRRKKPRCWWLYGVLLYRQWRGGHGIDILICSLWMVWRVDGRSSFQRNRCIALGSGAALHEVAHGRRERFLVRLLG